MEGTNLDRFSPRLVRAPGLRDETNPLKQELPAHLDSLLHLRPFSLFLTMNIILTGSSSSQMLSEGCEADLLASPAGVTGMAGSQVFRQLLPNPVVGDITVLARSAQLPAYITDSLPAHDASRVTVVE